MSYRGVLSRPKATKAQQQLLGSLLRKANRAKGPRVLDPTEILISYEVELLWIEIQSIHPDSEMWVGTKFCLANGNSRTNVPPGAQIMRTAYFVALSKEDKFEWHAESTDVVKAMMHVLTPLRNALDWYAAANR